jgi:hypothetical protein
VMSSAIKAMQSALTRLESLSIGQEECEGARKQIFRPIYLRQLCGGFV